MQWAGRSSGTWLPLIAPLLLAACDKADNEPGPGGVTVGEARALDRAAEMIEDRALPSAAPQPELGQEPEPAGREGPVR